MGGRVRFRELADMMGAELTARVCARLHGKRVTIGKKPFLVREEYLARRMGYNSIPADEAARLLGCTVRYLKHLKSLGKNRSVF